MLRRKRGCMRQFDRALVSQAAVALRRPLTPRLYSCGFGIPHICEEQGGKATDVASRDCERCFGRERMSSLRWNADISSHRIYH
jgi:hypothetical protein